jgi:urease accessory protein
MKKQISTKFTEGLALGILLVPTLAQAHPGHGPGIVSGIAHPFSGPDHLAAMLGVGLWAAQLGGRARFLVPGAFVATMLFGGILGSNGFAPTGMEQGIIASALVLGLLLAAAKRLSAVWAMALVAGFAVFHGMAHGSELPVGAEPVTYSAGFLVSTIALQFCGLGLGSIALRFDQPAWLRLGGASIVLVGVGNLASVF